MDQQQLISSLPLVLLAVILLWWLSSRKPSNLPPGPWKLPVVGNLHQLVGPLPHRTLWELSKKHGPLMHLRMGQVSTVVFSSPESAKEVLKTYDVDFASRPPVLATSIISYECTSITFAPYGDYWRQMRKICILELLSGRRVASFRSVREKEMNSLVEWVRSQSGQVINLTEKIYDSQYAMTSTAAFGKRCREQEKFVGLIKEAIEFVAGFNIVDLFPSIKVLEVISGARREIEKIRNECDKILEDIIEDHKDKKRGMMDSGGFDRANEDLVDVFLRVQAEANLDFVLTTDNIKAVILDIFSAGSETPATVADWIMSEVMKSPRILAKAQKEVREVFDERGKADESGISDLKYLKSIVKEGLRLHPPVPLLLPRECAKACQINGYTVPLKTKGIINAWALGRDPNCWENPEEFYPERFDHASIDYKGNYMEYIPFGAGRRICPAMQFGLAQVELQIAMLLYHFDWGLPNGKKNEDLDMSETFAVTVRRKDDLLLIPTPYRP